MLIAGAWRSWRRPSQRRGRRGPRDDRVPSSVFGWNLVLLATSLPTDGLRCCCAKLLSPSLRPGLHEDGTVLLPIPESVRETVAEGFARATDPEGLERRGLLKKALAAIQK